MDNATLIAHTLSRNVDCEVVVWARTIKLRVVGKTMLRLIGLFNPFMREMVEMNYLMTEPLIMDDSALQRLIGPIRKTPYAQGIRQTLAAVASTRALATTV